MLTIQDIDRAEADRIRAAREPLIAALTRAAAGKPWRYLLFGSPAARRWREAEKLVQEPKPEGRRWHENLLTMVTAPDELRRFRHLAVHGYDGFRIERAAPAIEAARRVAEGLPQAFEAFGREPGLLPGG